MADGIKFDISELTELVLQIGRVEPTISEQMPKVIQDSGRRLRDDARARAPKGGHVKGFPSKITSDYRPGIRRASVEVGPILGGVGSLGGLLEFGGPRSGPHPYLHPAFDAETPKLDAAVLLVASKALGFL